MKSTGRTLLLLVFSAALFNPLAAARAGTFRHVVIDNSPSRPAKPYIKLAGDLDGDGRADIAAASARDGGASWYRSPDWQRLTIVEAGTFSEQGAMADMDRDGDLDLVLPGKAGIHWYENRLAATGSDGNWPVHRIGGDGANVHDLVVADLDRDGELEVAVRYEKELRRPVTVFDRTDAGAWSVAGIYDHFGEGLAAGDVDGDGWTDLVINEVFLRNGGSAWTWIPIQFASGMPDQLKVVCADLNGDGRDDIVLSPQSRVPEDRVGKIACYFLACESGSFSWEECVLEEGRDEVSKVHGVATGDMDGDGDVDIVTSKRHDAIGAVNIAVFTNRSGTGRSWSKRIAAFSGSHNHVLADLDGDGRLDILGANWNDEAVVEAWIQIPGESSSAER